MTISNSDASQNTVKSLKLSVLCRNCENAANKPE